MPDAMVEQLRATASVEPLLIDETALPTAVGKRGRSLSPKIIRAVLLRDGHCRCGNCDLNYGLHAHHIRPKSWGGTDEISNLAAVASVHHPVLIPNGPYALVGNPNLPDGLRMVHINDLSPRKRNRWVSHGLEPDRGPHDAAAFYSARAAVGMATQADGRSARAHSSLSPELSP